ncbi:MAG: zinc transporter ZntB [Aestuariivita sp.]|uniref:zinc transporter ZntB n=1 Tax=Aestuariivita sp. TaxID=1872407 RepID=UPI003BAF682C
MTAQQTGLLDVIALQFDGSGGAQAVDPAHLSTDTGAFSWLHLRRDHPGAERLLETCGLDEYVVKALTAEETRPRCTVHGRGVVLNLRGVNLNPGAEPEDMVSVRLWLEPGRIVGVWVRPLVAVADLVAAIERGDGPRTVGGFVADLALRLADRAEPAIAGLNERIDAIEEAMLESQPDIARGELAGLRRAAILLRRYLVPQRDALTTLDIESRGWMQEDDRAHLREAAERMLRLGEELDAIRDRAQVVHDQVMDQRAEGMNRRMLVLSVVAAIFLPLGLLTGLLGINVGGVPGVNDPHAFAIVCALLVAMGIVLFIWFRRIGMFR